MRTRMHGLTANGWVWLLALGAVASAQAQSVTQTFSLQNGWNAIHLEVEPADSAPAVVFGGLPVASVWTRADRLAAAEFIQDPEEAAFNQGGWQVWLPGSGPETLLKNLFAIQGNRSYLVRVTNAVASWSVTGRPALRRIGWAPDAYNLRGFPISATAPPTFGSYFSSAAAHLDPATGTVDKVYRLDAAGHWVLAGPGERMRRGEAYWVYSRGASEFAGPVEVVPERGDGLDFGGETQEFKLEVRNQTATPQTLTLTLRSPTVAGALVYQEFHAEQGGAVWTNLPAAFDMRLAAGERRPLRLGLRRSLLGNATYAARLELGDSAGGAQVLPVSASKPPGLLHPYQGLWVGEATVTAVAEANGLQPTQPTPTRTGFPLRILIHVDAQGRPRFLREVIQMWRSGTYTNDAQGNRIVDKPGQPVLLTDDRLLGQFQGATLRDGVPVGRRLSTAGFDFDAGATNCLAMTGAFAPGGTLALTVNVPPDLPTNPYKHRYHPDHDNLNGDFEPLTGPAEVYGVTRQIELQLSGQDTGRSEVDYGQTAVAGTYREVLTGLHKRPLHLQGTFRLSRVTPIPALNPSPTP